MSGKKDSVSPPLPWKTKLAIKILTTVTDFAKRSDDSVNRTVVRFMNLRAKSNAKPLKGVVATDVTVDPARDLWFRLYVPSDHLGDPALPVVLFFHGGGFTYLTADAVAYDAFCRCLARKTPAVVISVDYRLSPENRYPAQYEDGYDTLKFLDLKNCQGFPENADLSKCFLAGDSAGGNISHFVARRFAEEESEFRRVRVVGLVAIQPFFGGEERTESEIRLDGAPLVSTPRADWHWRVFLPIGSDRDHEACNVFGPKSSEIQNVGAFPATMVVIGGFDPLQDRQRMYYEGLKSRVTSDKEVRLVEYPNAIHAFYIFPDSPEAPLFITEMVGFIRKHSQVSQG
ncbi:hypothetical protein Scep_002994 [Stephania cephalantha]|uniref:Alpha/beta hydrolase fold-3 domain-containing protein n=1 Tax=Stephania cephalantha TaxID=152367 RepID=A0AAP0LB15_9MAGN